MRWRLLILFIVGLLVSGCSLFDLQEQDSSSAITEKLGLTATPLATNASTATVTQATSPVQATAESTGQADKLEVVSEEEPGAFAGWQPANPLPDPYALNENTAERQASFEVLLGTESEERDDIELARLYKGWQGEIQEPKPVTEPLSPGTIEELRILNHDANTLSPVSVELLAVGRHAYFWFDTGSSPSAAELEREVQIFDQFYEQTTAIFGVESNPGVDGDPRLHVVHVLPTVLCDIGLTDFGRCDIVGYFSSSDLVPTNVDPTSNAREMFVMNTDYFAGDFYMNALTHELRHMIEEKYDRNDIDWAVEGSATFAAELITNSQNAVLRANLFLEDPDRQLNSWPDENTIPAYGQGYLLNRFIYERLGSDFYRQFATSPENGLAAIDVLAPQNGVDLTGQELWLDWLIALALHDYPEGPIEYDFDVRGLDEVAMTQISRFPATYEETVHQFAADYYRIEGDEEVVIIFEGNTTVPLLKTAAASGDSVWLANRANYSHAHLTRAIDLTNVDSATLNFSVFSDIEEGYDFAYLFVSQDDGQTWQPLVTQNMRGRDADPRNSALADNFYTGQSGGWVDESIDLTPYTGNSILIRFAYVTDPIKTFGGLALDNISVPELDFYDDAESLTTAWTAAGFDRVTSSIPQQWQLQLITFPDGRPEVKRLELNDNQQLTHELSLDESDGQAILIVAASSPKTLEQARYRLQIEELR